MHPDEMEFSVSVFSVWYASGGQNISGSTLDDAVEVNSRASMVHDLLLQSQRHHIRDCGTRLMLLLSFFFFRVSAHCARKNTTCRNLCFEWEGKNRRKKKTTTQQTVKSCVLRSLQNHSNPARRIMQQRIVRQTNVAHFNFIFFNRTGEIML